MVRKRRGGKTKSKMNKSSVGGKIKSRAVPERIGGGKCSANGLYYSRALSLSILGCLHLRRFQSLRQTRFSALHNNAETGWFPRSSNRKGATEDRGKDRLNERRYEAAIIISMASSCW